jgi:hypothetical protein
MGEQRRKVWIDNIQTYLSIRIAFYILSCQVITALTFYIVRVVFFDFTHVIGLDAPGLPILFLVVSLGTIGGLFIYDAIKYSHRIVGPIYRFRKTIRAIIDGDDVELVHLRQGDQLQEMREEFNQMLKILEERGAIRVKTVEKDECATSAAE